MILDWRLRIAAKLVLSRLPVGYGFWRQRNLFRHGKMDDPGYATRVFATHYRRYVEAGGRPEGYSVLELGPGDSLGTALIARAHRAAETILVDAVDAAENDMAPYRRLADHLRRETGHRVAEADLANRKALLANNNGRYLTDGLASLRSLPDASLDFIFSHAVLEHIRRAEFEDHLRELHRILKPGGIMSHRIDFKDHLGGGLNNLRFSHSCWEAPWFAEAGFYTNRLRCSEVMRMLDAQGFRSGVLHRDTWQTPPLPRTSLAADFRNLSDDDIRVSGIDVVSVR